MGEEDNENADKYGDKETEVPSVMDANRSCRDILCLLLFLVAWIGWIIVAAMAFSDGCPDNCNDPRKLVFGFDSNGCMCSKDCSGDPGIRVDNSKKKRLYMPDPREASNRICVEECPPGFAFSKAEAVSYGAYQCSSVDCLSALGSDLSAAPSEFYLQRERGDLMSGAGSLDNCFLSGSREGDCWYPSYPTSDVFYKCIPALPANLSDADLARMESMGLPAGSAAFGDALAVMQNPAGEFGKLTGEVTDTWPLLIGSVAIAVVIGFVFLVLIRLFALPMMWLIVIGLVLLLLLSTIFAWDKTGKVEIFSQLSDATGQNISALADAAGESAGFEGGAEPALVEAAAWILTIVTVAYIVLLFFFLKRIVIAVKVIVEAAKCMAAVPTMILQPLWTFLSLAVLYTWAGFITVYLVSAGEFDPATGTFTYAGGTCRSDLSNSTLSVTHTTAIVTLALASGASLSTGSYSPLGTSSITSFNGLVEITDSALMGSDCYYDSALRGFRCDTNSNTTSSDNMGTGGCLGEAADPTCRFQDRAGPWAYQATAENAGTQGEVSWNSSLGRIGFYIAENTTLAGPTSISFALNIYRCSKGGTCSTWDISGNPMLGGVSVPGVTYSVKTAEVESRHVISESEALRSCNLYSTKEKASEKLLSTKQVALGRQGKADLRELRPSSWSSKPTVDNWKGFLPVTLDGETYNYFVLYHLFMFLWTNQFTVSSGYYIICGTVAAWYWSLDKKDLPRGMVAKSTYRYVRYNLGTVAFGSFIIAVVQMIRILFNYFVSKSKQFKDNPVVKALVCLVNCCLWCLEKVIGYINKNAYIMSATHGYGFCKGAWKGFMLLMRNLLRVAAVNVVAVAILFFGKIFITLTTLCIAYLIAQQFAADLNLLNGPPFLSLVIIAIMAWFVGSSFMNTYSAAVDTIFLSFLHDQESNDGSPGKPYYMADSLRSSIGVKNAKVTPGEPDNARPQTTETTAEREGATD